MRQRDSNHFETCQIKGISIKQKTASSPTSKENSKQLKVWKPGLIQCPPHRLKVREKPSLRREKCWLALTHPNLPKSMRQQPLSRPFLSLNPPHMPPWFPNKVFLLLLGSQLSHHLGDLYINIRPPRNWTPFGQPTKAGRFSKFWSKGGS